MIPPVKTMLTVPAALWQRLAQRALQEGIPEEDFILLTLERLLPDDSGAVASVPVHQGQIYWVHPPGVASVSAVAHPSVVLQPDVFNNSRLTTTIVCALTSNIARASLPGNILLPAGEANLAKPSVVEVSKLSVVETAHLGAFIGALEPGRVEQILAGVRFVQALTPPR